MGIVLTKNYMFTFNSDGVSTTFSVDVSLLPFYEQFRGMIPTQATNQAVTSTFTGPVSGVTIGLAGTTVTFTLASALPEVDGSSNVISYTGSFTLRFN